MYTAEELIPTCPVCGYDKLPQPPFDEHGYPTYVICSCCGFEFGVTDESDGWSYASYREKWINDGCPFFLPMQRPPSWSMDMAKHQLGNLVHVAHYAPR